MLNRLLARACILFLGMFCSQALLPVKAAEQKVWQIGEFDKSSGEFRIQLSDYADPKLDPVYTIGKSEPAKDWVALQPGSANTKAGFRPHPFTILFDLPDAPQGSYSLVVALLHYSPRLPILQVEINGHRGWFYQRPKLNYDAGDTADVFLPIYSADTIKADLPTHFLQKGPNKLVLTAIDEPSERDDAQSPIIVGNSAIIYDAVELVHDPAGHYSAGKVTAEAIPTIFYKSSADGLTEIVDARVRSGQPCRNGKAVLTVGKTKLTQPLACDREFGEQQVDFEVPEFTSNVKGELAVTLSGRTSRFPVELRPAKKWTIFVVPHEHLDIGYSDYQSKVAEIQSRAIDEALGMIRSNPEYRYSMDGYWCAEQFMRGRGKEDVEKFKEAVAGRKIFVPAQYASDVTGFATLEDLIRSFYPTHEFQKQVGAPNDYANITDVPSYSWSYASVMAAAGLKYFIAASDNYRAPILLIGREHENTPFWWEGPDGGKVLMWYSRHYHQVATLFGLPPSVTAGRDSLPLFLEIYNRPEYKSDAVLVFGTQVENTDLFPQQADLVNEWNKLYAYPKMRFSGFSEPMAYIARQMGDSSGLTGKLWMSFGKIC
ncbi:MAG: hypothetical protein LAP13_27675 [Acidobacteriia bacterium]|nr:hypothetical protein [Terriglobia bacterium]